MKTLNATEGKITGTPAQLAGRIAINGKVLQQPDISFLTRMGFATQVGTVKKTTEGRGGKPAIIWEFDAKKVSFQLEPLARKQRPGKRGAKDEASEAPVSARKSANKASDTNGEAPKRRGRQPKAANDNSGLAQQIASAIVNVLDNQKAA